MAGVSIPTSNVTYNYAKSGTIVVDALLDSSKWGGNLGTTANLTYSFPYSTGSSAAWEPYYSTANEPAYSPSGLNTAQQAAAEAAMQQWASVANINFNKVAETSTSTGDTRFTFTNSASIQTSWGWAYYPDKYSPSGGDIWINSQYKSESFAVGTYHFEALMHELGHALGLKHSFEGDTILPKAQESTQYTLMSYTAHPHNLYLDIVSTNNGYKSNYSYIYTQTPMLYDIAAIQYLYGANTSYRAGNDIYSFDPATPFFKTIWDAGGNDTATVSNFTAGCTINLQAGMFSKITIDSDPMPSGAIGWTTPTYDGTDNLAIAFGVTIENAIGGSGDDTLIGNDVANQLTGNVGSDFLNGMGGIDTAIYGESRSTLTITKNSDGSYNVTGPLSGSDLLMNIELIRCTDAMVSFDTVGGAGKSYRLYQAAFDRIPDPGGLGYWITAADNGIDMVNIAASFINSPEFAAKYGATPSNTDFITLLYANVLHRLPDPSGYDFWIDRLVSGADRAAVLYGFSESPENQGNVASLIANGITYQEWII